MSDVIERIKRRTAKEYERLSIAITETDKFTKQGLFDCIKEFENTFIDIVDEELAKEPQGDIPVQCVDGSCPMALAEEYADCGMDVVHSCDECQYKPAKEPQECNWTKGIHSVETCWGDIDIKIFNQFKRQGAKFCPYCGRKIKVI